MTIADSETPDAPTTAAQTTATLSTARKAVIGALVVVIAVAGVLLFTLSGDNDPEVLVTGEPSEFHLTEVVALEGGTTDFTHLQGTPVILNFFASWCAPCKAEMPTLDDIHRAFEGEVAVVGLAIEGERPARETVEETGVTYFIGLDEDGVLLDRYEGFGMPTTVFFDANGLVVDTHIGELTEEAFRDRIDELFGIGDV